MRCFHGKDRNPSGLAVAIYPTARPQYVDFALQATLPKGKYTVIALIDADDDTVPVEAAQRQIVVK